MPISRDSEEWKNANKKNHIRQSITQLLNSNPNKAFTVSEIHDHVFKVETEEENVDSCKGVTSHIEDRQVTLSVVLRILDELVSEMIADSKVVEIDGKPVAYYSRKDETVYM